MPTFPNFWRPLFTLASRPLEQEEPAVVQLANGDFWVVWRDRSSAAPGNPPGHDILGQRFDALGNTIGGVALIGTFADSDEASPDLAANGGSLLRTYTSNQFGFPVVAFENDVAPGRILFTDGAVRNAVIASATPTNAMIVWQRETGSGGFRIDGRAFDPTSTNSFQTAPELIFATSTTLLERPQLIALTGGNYVLTWQFPFNGDPSDVDIAGRVVNQAGTVVANFTVANATSIERDVSIAALNAGGGFVIAYERAGDIIAKIYNASGVQQGSEIVVAGGANVQRESAIAATVDGGFVVLWEDATAGQFLAQSYTGGGFAQGGLATIANELPAGPVAATAMADGRILVSYSSPNNQDIRVAILDPRVSMLTTPVYTGQSRLVGTPFADTFTATADLNHGGEGNDDITDPVGTQTLIDGGGGNDTIRARLEGLQTIDGGTGDDTLIMIPVFDSYIINLTTMTSFGRNGGTVFSFAAANFENYLSTTAIPHTVEGTSGVNRIETGGGADILSGLAGDDHLIGGGANDTIEGGPGADRLEGGDGDADVLSYASSPAGVTVNLSNNTASGGDAAGDIISGFENITGSAHNDSLTGSSVSNRLEGGGGNDALAAVLGGIDTLVGGAGNDSFLVAAATDIVVEAVGGGSDDVSTLVSYTLPADAEIETLGQFSPAALTLVGNGFGQTVSVANFGGTARGMAGNDVLTGRSSTADVLDGGDDNDSLNGSGGADQLLGGNGDDTITVNNLATSGQLGGFIDGGAGNDLLNLTGSVGNATLGAAQIAGIERIRLGLGDLTLLDSLVGAGGLLTFETTLTPATLTINGAAETNGAFLFLVNDTGKTVNLTGGAGADGFYLGAALNGLKTLNGGGGTLDTLGLQGTYANLALLAQHTQGIEIVALLPGDDARFGGATGTSLSYTITPVDAAIAAGQTLIFQANTLRAGEAFTLNGSAETDGSFFTFGGLGTDILTGGQQVDGFYFGTGRWGAADRLDGQAGVDQFGLQGNYSGANAITLGATQLTSIEFIVLLSASDTRFGGGNLGQSFSYNLTTNDGNVAAGQRMIIQANSLVAAESLILNGSAETNGAFQVFAGAGADTIIGSQGADDVFAQGGVDRVEGRGGADTLRGGFGADVFGYLALSDSTAAARDQLLDFASGDLIDLSALDANGVAGGQQAFTLIANGAAFTAAGQLRITQTGTQALIEGDSDGDGVADFAIDVTVVDGHALTLADFAGVAAQQDAVVPADLYGMMLRPVVETYLGASSDFLI